MKKIIAFSLIAVLMIGGAVTVHAATTAQRPCQTQECFVDENKDGICDNRADCQKDGTCPMNGQNCPNGNGFVDADEDGICDNRADCQKDGTCPMNGQNCPNGNGFVDADKDGICENRVSRPAGSCVNKTVSGSHHGGSGHRGSHHG